MRPHVAIAFAWGAVVTGLIVAVLPVPRVWFAPVLHIVTFGDAPAFLACDYPGRALWCVVGGGVAALGSTLWRPRDRVGRALALSTVLVIAFSLGLQAYTLWDRPVHPLTDEDLRDP